MWNYFKWFKWFLKKWPKSLSSPLSLTFYIWYVTYDMLHIICNIWYVATKNLFRYFNISIRNQYFKSDCLRHFINDQKDQFDFNNAFELGTDPPSSFKEIIWKKENLLIQSMRQCNLCETIISSRQSLNHQETHNDVQSTKKIVFHLFNVTVSAITINCSFFIFKSSFNQASAEHQRNRF